MNEYKLDKGPNPHPTDRIAREVLIQRKGHEVRSLVQVLLGYFDIVSHDLEPKLVPEDRLILERMRFYIDRLANLVTELYNQSFTKS